MTNQQLAEELHKTIIIKFEKRMLQYIIYKQCLGADLTDMQYINKLDKGYL